MNEISKIVRAARRRNELTQAELGKAMDRSRFWVMQLERGEWHNGADFKVDAAMLIKLAGVLNIDPHVLLAASDIPEDEWPNLSHGRSNAAIVRTVELHGLSDKQANLVKQIVAELRAGNDNNKKQGKQRKR